MNILQKLFLICFAPALFAQDVEFKPFLDANQQVKQIAINPQLADPTLFWLNASGQLKLKSASGEILIGKGFEPTAPLSVSGNKIVGVAKSGELKIIENNQVRLIPEIKVSPKSAFLLVNDCVFGITGDRHPFRVCGEEIQIWQDLEALHDARPVLFNDQILILGQPSADVYQHGVLGDDWEALALFVLDQKTNPHRTITLPEGLVFEANTVQIWQNQVMVQVSGKGNGARIALIELKTGEITAQSEALPMQRWQSPFIFNGRLYAVLMPHLKGQLVEYILENNVLLPKVLSAEQFSNHEIGSYETQIALITDELAFIPNIKHHEIWQLNQNNEVKFGSALPSKTIKGVVQNNIPFYLLSDGSVWVKQ